MATVSSTIDYPSESPGSHHALVTAYSALRKRYFDLEVSYKLAIEQIESFDSNPSPSNHVKSKLDFVRSENDNLKEEIKELRRKLYNAMCSPSLNRTSCPAPTNRLQERLESQLSDEKDRVAKMQQENDDLRRRLGSLEKQLRTEQKRAQEESASNLSSKMKYDKMKDDMDRVKNGLEEQMGKCLICNGGSMTELDGVTALCEQLYQELHYTQEVVLGQKRLIERLINVAMAKKSTTEEEDPPNSSERRRVTLNNSGYETVTSTLQTCPVDDQIPDEEPHNPYPWRKNRHTANEDLLSDLEIVRTSIPAANNATDEDCGNANELMLGDLTVSMPYPNPVGNSQTNFQQIEHPAAPMLTQSIIASHNEEDQVTMVGARVCPVCALEFGTEVEMGDFQKHVLDCAGPPQAPNQRICPVCQAYFSDIVPQTLFLDHVEKHFS